jgi:tyrosine-protein kinase Etk/Wzc
MNTSAIHNTANEQPEGGGIKLILSSYARYWYLFLIGTILSLAGAFLYLRYYAVPQYRVYSTMLIKDEKNGQSLSNVEALSDLSSFKSNQNIYNEVEVLKSKSLMRRVIDELNLSVSYFVKGKFRYVELYGNGSPIKLIAGKLDSSVVGQSMTVTPKLNSLFDLTDFTGKTKTYKFGQKIVEPYGDFSIIASPGKVPDRRAFTIRFQDVEKISSYYNSAVSIQLADKNTSVLNISLIDSSPERAKDIINKLMQVYNGETIEDKNSMAANTMKFLDERISYLTNDLVSVEKGAAKFKSNNSLTDITTQASDYSAQAIDYNKQLSKWAIQTEVLESIASYLQKPDSKYSSVPSTLGIEDETLIKLIGEFNKLQLDRENMLRTVQPTSVLVLNINEQLEALRINIIENLQNIKEGIKITRSRLQNSSGQFQSKIRRVPGMERELNNITRQQEIKNNVYAYLLQKREETALSLAASVSAARVLDSALGGDFPISPNTQAVYLMALLLGLSLPAAVIYGVGLLSDKVKTQQDVTSATTVPIIGEIVNNKSKEHLVVAKGIQSPIAEIFRLIRANINFAASGKENVVLMVTSSMSGEGKTFFSINLGASLALTNKKVVIVDLDLRASKVSQYMNIPEGLGVSNYLTEDNIELSDIVKYSNNVPNLAVVSAGFIPLDPAELLMGPKFAHLVHELKSNFDYIIFDTPPVGKVAEAFTLNYFIDYTLYVVRYNYTYKGQLNIIRDAHRQNTLKNIMVVMNDAKSENGQSYGYGYGYGYKEKRKVKA